LPKGNFVTIKFSRVDRPDAAQDADAEAETASDILPRPDSGRRLRNWIILANIGAWILIVLVIRWIFF
jgi:hypothetical protein